MICGPCATSNHHACTGLLRALAGFCRCADREHQPAVGTAATHRCGRCGSNAQYVDRSHSGAVLYVCYACDGKGHPTFVYPRYAPVEARS